jgi:hypothetical protein
VLFVRGELVAFDSAQPMGSQDGMPTIRFGSDERYEVPDALLSGG